MDPRWTRLALLPLLALPLALACGDKDGDDSGSPTGDGGATDGGGTGDGGSTAGGGTLTGQVLNADGSPASVQMRLCAELCRSVMTEADGTFEYLAVEADHYAFEAVNLADQKNYATPLDLISLGQDEVRALSTPMILYPFATVHDLGDKLELVELDGGLTVMADPSAMTASEANSPYLQEGDPDYVAAVRVDPAAIGLPLDEVEGTVHAAWFMGRMSVTLSPPWSFTLDEDLGLAEGTQVRILASDYDGKEWKDGGTATVTGGTLAADDGSGIPVLSTVLLVSP
ncbi:hypothetical protein L6R53_24655 [Myxococcota bacterium]|nr:hypothetical protein [Myxococcota bacterium]